MNNKIFCTPILVLILGFVVWLSCPTDSIRIFSATYANAGTKADEHVKASLVADTKAIVPGKPFRLGVQLIMNPGWHTYYKEPGDAGMATKIIWQLPAGFKSGPLIWEKPEKFSDSGIVTYGYVDKTLIASEITPPKQISKGRKITFSARVEWLSCKDLCVPGHAEVNLVLDVASGNVVASSYADNNEFAKANFENTDSSSVESNQKFDILNSSLGEEENSAKNSFALYFIFAFLGGIILNFMPCVLPVVAIKVLSLLEQNSKEMARRSTMAFASGIFSSFLLLGLLVVSLQAAGHQIGWGFQFQQPIFLMFMATLVLLFALSLFGLFDISFSFGQQTVNQLADKQGLSGDFFKGVLATILSTPCTAPFLGTALGFAFAQSWVITLTIFAAVGTGMCVPYIILIVAPGYIKYLPKPGVWMEKLKEAFGFVLLATTIWLVTILSGQVNNERLVGFEYFLLVIAFVIWLMHRFTNLASSSQRLLAVRSIALVIVLFASYFCLFNKPGSLYANTMSDIIPGSESEVEKGNFQPFSIANLNQSLNDGKTVFLDFTARWCLTCQVNETSTINTKAVQDKMQALHVVFMKADWTRQDPTITSLLKKFGRSGVPLYVIFPAKNPSQPIILPELVTQQIVLEKLDEAGSSLR